MLPAFIITLIVYGSYLFFQLYSHAALYSDEGGDASKSTPYTPRSKKGKVDATPPTPNHGNTPSGAMMVQTSFQAANNTDAHNGHLENGTPTSANHENEEHEKPMLSLPVTIGLLVIVTVVHSQFCSSGCIRS